MYKDSVIVFKNKGQIVPEDFWNRALPLYGKAASVALIEKDLLVFPFEKEEINLENVQGLCEAHKDKALMFFLADFEDGYQKDSLQPFVLISNKDNKPVLTVTMQGTFNQYEQPKGSHSNSFYAAQEFLIPELLDYYEGKCSNKIDSLMQLLREDKRLRTKLEGLLSPSGILCFLANTGETVTIQNNRNVANFDFGWSTNSCGYAGKQEEPPKVEDKKQGFLDRIKSATGISKASESPPPVPKETPKEEEVKGAPGAPPTEEEKTTEREHVTRVVSLPDRALAKNEKKDFWRAQLGFLPPDYLKVKSFQVRYYKDKGVAVGENGQELLQGKSRFLEKLRNEFMADTAGNAAGSKDVSPHHIPAPEAKAPSATEVAAATGAATAETAYPSSGTLSVLSDLQRENFQTDFIEAGHLKKTLDQHSQLITNPEKMRTELAKIKNFTDETGWTIEQVFALNRDAMIKIAEASPEHLALLCLQLMQMTPEFKQYIASIQTPPKKEEAATKPSVPKAGLEQTRPQRQKLSA